MMDLVPPAGSSAARGAGGLDSPPRRPGSSFSGRRAMRVVFSAGSSLIRRQPGCSPKVNSPPLHEPLNRLFPERGGLRPGRKGRATTITSSSGTQSQAVWRTSLQARSASTALCLGLAQISEPEQTKT